LLTPGRGGRIGGGGQRGVNISRRSSKPRSLSARAYFGAMDPHRGAHSGRMGYRIGLAQAQWECGCLDHTVLAEVERIVAAGAGADDWWKERRGVLRQFLRTIRVPRSQPRPRTRRIVLPPVYGLAAHGPDGSTRWQDEWARGVGSYARVHEEPRRTHLH